MARKNVYKEKLELAKKWLEGIRDYDRIEVAKDEFAYDRLRNAYREAARNALSALEVENAS